jgi:hypothetical protein
MPASRAAATLPAASEARSRRPKARRDPGARAGFIGILGGRGMVRAVERTITFTTPPCNKLMTERK